jgi:hypothetical protein
MLPTTLSPLAIATLLPRSLASGRFSAPHLLGVFSGCCIATQKNMRGPVASCNRVLSHRDQETPWHFLLFLSSSRCDHSVPRSLLAALVDACIKARQCQSSSRRHACQVRSTACSRHKLTPPLWIALSVSAFVFSQQPASTGLSAIQHVMLGKLHAKQRGWVVFPPDMDSEDVMVRNTSRDACGSNAQGPPIQRLGQKRATLVGTVITACSSACAATPTAGMP